MVLSSTMRYISNTSFIFSGILLLLLVATLAVSTVRTVYADSEAPKSGECILVIHDGNIEHGVLTKATTVREALEEAEIPFDTNDLVEPSLDEKLIAKTYDVNIYRARPITLVDGAVRKKIMSAYRTPKQIVEHAAAEQAVHQTAEPLGRQQAIEQIGGLGEQATVEQLAQQVVEHTLGGEHVDRFRRGGGVDDLIETHQVRLAALHDV